jgi:hypothetical protein
MRVLAVCLMLLLSAPAGASDSWTRALMEPAERIWNPLPTGVRVAVRPLDADDSGLRNDLLRGLERALMSALLATAPAGADVSTRRDLVAAWEEAESFASATTRRLLADAAVHAVLVPSVVQTRSGVSLAGVLLAVRAGETGDVLATLPATELAVDVTGFDRVSADAAARRLGVALAERLRQAIDPGLSFAPQVSQAGLRSPVADWLAAQVSEHLHRRLAAQPLFITRPLSTLSEAPRAGTAVLRLDVWDLGAFAEVHARADFRGAQARATARISKASLPRAFLPLTRDGGRVGDGLYRAAAWLRTTAGVDPRETVFRARAGARAALVDDRLGRGTGQARIAGWQSLERAMRRLETAIPHEEIWTPDGHRAEGETGQILNARVRRVGGPAAPAVEPWIERALYRPGDSLRVLLVAGQSPAFVAGYVWQADDTVVRISPRDGDPRRLDPGDRVRMPPPGGVGVTPTPLPGSEESWESVIVVASAVPFDAASLAPWLGATAPESLSAAVQMSAFLDALARLDLARVTLKILPYRVRRRG